MSTSRIMRFVLSLTLVAGLSLAGCTPPPRTPIRIGISAWAGVEPAELAARKGFYAQRGVTVEMVRFSAYTDSIDAFRNGQVDADMQTYDDAIRLFAGGKAMRLVLFTDYSFGGDGIVARPEIASVADLKGKRVGVETGTVGHFSLLKALDTAGLHEADVTIVSIPAWEIKEAFEAGEIDAGVTWEPYLTSTAEEGGGHVIITSRDYPRTIVTSMVVSEELITTRPDDVQKIVAAYFDAVQFLQSNPDDAYAVMAQAESIAPAEFASQVQGLRYITLPENQTIMAQGGEMYATGRQLTSFLFGKGLIKAEPDIARLLDNRFVIGVR